MGKHSCNDQKWRPLLLLLLLPIAAAAAAAAAGGWSATAAAAFVPLGQQRRRPPSSSSSSAAPRPSYSPLVFPPARSHCVPHRRRPHRAALLGATNDDDKGGDEGGDADEGEVSSSSLSSPLSSLAVDDPQRRQFFFLGGAATGSAIASLAAAAAGGGTAAAHARGLVQFPCDYRLGNAYHFLRVGQTLLEEEDMWSSNPLFLTNRDDALSPAGAEQVVAACRLLQRDPPTVVKYSLAASCIDASSIVGRELRLGRDRLVPEFTFLDPRGLGGWDLTSKRFTEPAVWALDADEAGADGLGARPPPNTDGTPHETLSDAAVRLRQLLSILESQSQGETYLLIFPDGTGPALLSAMMAGIPYNRAHELEFAPGEVRMNVTLPSVRALWQANQEPEAAKAFQAVLAQGRENLAQLRAGKAVVNLKDEKIESERLEVEQEYMAKEQQRRKREEQEEAARNAVRKQSEVDRGDIRSSSSDPGASAEPPNMWMGSALAGLAAVAVGAGSTALSQQEEGETLAATAVRGGSTNTTIYDAPATQPGTTAAVAASNRTVATATADEGLAAVATATSTNSDGGGGLYSAPTEGIITRQRVNGARNSTFLAQPPPQQLDPKEAARQAMEEYMDRDDGARDWLMSLTDILQEDDGDSSIRNNSQNNRNDDLVTMKRKDLEEEANGDDTRGGSAASSNPLNSSGDPSASDDGAFQ